MNIYIVRDSASATLEIVYANSVDKAAQLFRDHYGVSGVVSYVADDPERKREMLAGRTTPIYQLATLIERLTDERDDALALAAGRYAEAESIRNELQARISGESGEL